MTITILVIVVLAWMEILDVLESACSAKDFEPVNLLVRFGCYLVSRFYLVSVINIELLSKKPYQVMAWKGLWPAAFQATSFLMMADIFTYDYIECLSYHTVFSESTAFGFSFASLAITVLQSLTRSSQQSSTS